MFRAIIFSGTFFLLTGLAVGQVNGQATVVSEHAGSGAYSLPIVPLINTPSMTLGTTPAQTEVNNAASETNVSSESDSFEFGVARFQGSYGAAELASRSRRAKAAKVYTNQDVTQVNDTNGLVKFGNKTEHL